MSDPADVSRLLARRTRYALCLVLALSASAFVVALPDVIATPADREVTIVVDHLQFLPLLTLLLASILCGAAIPALRFRDVARRVLVAALLLAGFLSLAVLAFMLILIFQPASPPFAVLSPVFLPGLLVYALLAGLAFSLAYVLTRPRVRALFSSPPRIGVAV